MKSEVQTQHSPNATDLVPNIQIQENLITTITNKDPQFKQYTNQKIAQTKEYAKYNQEQGELMTFPLSGPDS